MLESFNQMVPIMVTSVKYPRFTAVSETNLTIQGFTLNSILSSAMFYVEERAQKFRIYERGVEVAIVDENGCSYHS